MVIASRPDVALNVAFNADPNDPAAILVWSDLTALFLGADGVDRGRQYELDETRAAQPTLRFIDRNEYLNPDNPSSPYAPNLVPYRQVVWQGMWPNTTAGNLLNVGYGSNPQLKTTKGYDPTFDSYTAGATVPWITAVGSTTPVVGTTTPHSGLNDLTWSVVTGFTPQGVQFVVPCIPGRTYTCTAYVRQTSASTQQIFVAGVASGSFSSATGAYFRLGVTWTATQPTHVVQVTTQAGFAVTGTVLLDDIQHEQAASPSAFTATGPTIYTVMDDLVERWPSRWDPDSQGFLGLCDVTCVDAFAALQATDLSTEVANAILAKKPAYYWKLNESQGVTTFVESSGNNGPSLQRLDGAFGPGPTFTAGAQTNLAGDRSGTGLASNTGAVSSNVPATVAQAGLSRTPGISLGGSNPVAWSVTLWFSHTTLNSLGGQTQYAFTIEPVNGSALTQIFGTDGSPNTLSVLAIWPGGSGAVTVTDSWADGKQHLFVATVSISGTSGTVTLYVDGTSVGTGSGAATAGFVNLFATNIQVGGFLFPLNLAAGAALPNGVYDHVALWNRALSAAEVTDLGNAGRGYSGEISGARVARYLSYGYIGPTVVDTGQSVMGVSALTDGTSVLGACQAVTTTENGIFWVDGDGNITFAGRTRRYLATTSAYVFGENTAGGELPYEGDIEFGLDPTLIYNDVQVTNAGGIIARASDAVSQKRFFRQSYPRDVNLASDLEAIDAANYLLNQHKVARIRVQTLTLNPGSNPSLWPVVLGIEVGTRVTVKRRSKAANNGVGLTQSRDFFVEQISHGGVDFEAGTWTTTLQLSPVDFSQVWILGDATYSVLDTTTVLGY